jgi:hypothetical protein
MAGACLGRLLGRALPEEHLDVAEQRKRGARPQRDELAAVERLPLLYRSDLGLLEPAIAGADSLETRAVLGAAVQEHHILRFLAGRLGIGPVAHHSYSIPWGPPLDQRGRA